MSYPPILTPEDIATLLAQTLGNEGLHEGLEFIPYQPCHPYHEELYA